MRLRHATREELIRAGGLVGLGRWAAAACRRLLEVIGEPSGRVLVAEEAGELRAVLGFVMDRDCGDGERRARIVELAVDPRHARRGIGSRLVRFAEGIARIEGCRRVDVAPRVEGWQAGRCWSALGYGGPTRHDISKPLGVSCCGQRA